MDDLLSEFLTETNESLASLDLALIRLEQTPGDRATLSEIFRLMHTIKGTCGFLGLPRLERVAHAAENVLGKYRDGPLEITADAVTLILSALDRIRTILSGLEAGQEEPPGDDSALIAALNAVATGQPAPEGAATPEAGPATAVEEAAPALPPALPETAPAPLAATQAAAADPVPVGAPPHRPDAAGPPESVAEGSGRQTIRVSVEVLEDLMTLVSELVLTRNQLAQIARQQEDSPFAVPLQRLSHITSELQEGVMKTRMQPIGHAWNKLPRLVRDLARELGKEIELSLQGAETELDRQVLELIRDPLTHMVRNSADHGIETPERRRAAGKPPIGRIRLNAFHEGGHIIMELADDGRGIDVEAVRAKAIASGLATEAELAALSDDQIRAFIFRPGFSTAAAVTAVSGRGVGMDVVRTNIERIGGTIDVRSVPGQGTTFTIKIPITLAIVSALIIETGAERFAIPQISVLELVQANGPATAIEHIGGTPVMRLRDRLLPLVHLGQLLGLPARENPAGNPYIVVTQAGTHNFGIIVDRVFDTEEIVVKPVAPVLRDISVFGGNTILGDGSVIMILDPAGIARATGTLASGQDEGRTAERAAVEAAGTAARVPLLLFRADDAAPKAVPLGLVARIEEIPTASIESANGRPVTQYRGRLLPLVALSQGGAGPQQPVLVFADGDRAMGLMVAAIVDVVEAPLQIQLGTERPGFLGSAVIAGQVTDILDCAFWLQRACPDWFGSRGGAGPGTRGIRRLLLVEDSGFFRQLVLPSLAAAGFEVSAVASASEALRLRDTGAMFDVIVSDVEMPGIDGFAFVQAIRSGGAWAQLPVLALTGQTTAADLQRAQAAGFTAYIAKSDHAGLLEHLDRCLGAPQAS